MTTIAYKAGILACDSAWANGSGCIATLLTKIFRLSSGACVGEAGDSDSRSVRLLLDKVKSFDKLPTAHELAECKLDYSALLVFQNGEVVELEIAHDKDTGGWAGQVWKVNRGFAAVGSGSELALGFMGAGESAAKAVAFACSWDPYSKLPVHTVHVRAPSGKSNKK